MSRRALQVHPGAGLYFIGAGLWRAQFAVPKARPSCPPARLTAHLGLYLTIQHCTRDGFGHRPAAQLPTGIAQMKLDSDACK